MRCAMTRVLPEPAPASMRSGPSVASTASRCCSFSCDRNSESTVRLHLSTSTNTYRMPHEISSQFDSKNQIDRFCPLLYDVSHDSDCTKQQRATLASGDGERRAFRRAIRLRSEIGRAHV